MKKTNQQSSGSLRTALIFSALIPATLIGLHSSLYLSILCSLALAIGCSSIIWCKYELAKFRTRSKIPITIAEYKRVPRSTLGGLGSDNDLVCDYSGDGGMVLEDFKAKRG